MTRLRCLITGLAILAAALLLAGCGGGASGLLPKTDNTTLPLAPVVDTGVRGNVTLHIAWPQPTQTSSRYIPAEAVKITVYGMGEGGDVQTVTVMKPEMGWNYSSATYSEGASVTLENMTGPTVRLSAVAFDVDNMPVAWGHGDASVNNGITSEGQIYLNTPDFRYMYTNKRLMTATLRWVRNGEQAPVVGQWWAFSLVRNGDGTEIGPIYANDSAEIFVTAGGTCFIYYVLPDPVPDTWQVPVCISQEFHPYMQFYDDDDNKTMKSFAPKYVTLTDSSPQNLGVILLTPNDAGADVAVQ